MLNKSLWLSFEEELSLADIEAIESRLQFLKEILESAITQYEVEDIRGELDLDLHVYLEHLKISAKTGDSKITPWLIHDGWFRYHGDAKDINPEIINLLRESYFLKTHSLKEDLEIFLKCTNLESSITTESDAVVWLTYLDYMAVKLLYKIGNMRLETLFEVESQ
ncbi:MAG: hypothetical protein CTY21_13300 [Methylomonas sp.]|nr:MAG: hypothetical protein CTY21_13300 [Methylomonas sp.]